MTTCPEARRLLEARVDDELAREEAEILRWHLETCADCREEEQSLTDLKRNLRDHFLSLQASAPSPPSFGARASTSGKSSARRWRSSLPAAAAILLAAIVLGFVMFPRGGVDASAREILGRAAERYLMLRDVELWIVPESDAVDTLETLFGKTKKPTKPLPSFRLLLQAPDRALLHTTDNLDLDAPWTRLDPVIGYDGGLVWSYDSEEGVIEIGSAPVEFERLPPPDDLTGENLGFIRYLSWGFLQKMAGENDEWIVREKTGPSDRRAGRRVITTERQPRPADDGEDEKRQLLTVVGTFTIDPRKDLVEKMVFEVKLTGFSLLELTLEVADFNRGFPAEIFRPDAHAPPGTPVKRRDEDSPAEKPEPEEG